MELGKMGGNWVRAATVGATLVAGAPAGAAPPTLESPAIQEPADVYQPSQMAGTRSSWLKTQLQNSKPGTLLVLDDFMPPAMGGVPGPSAAAVHFATHGQTVVDTARQSGFSGKMVGLEINRPLNDSELQTRYGKMNDLWQNGKTPEDFRTSLYERAVNNRTRLLDNATAGLTDMVEAGAKDSVANLSLSSSQAATTDNLLKSLIPKDPKDPESVARARAERAKYAQAFGVNDADLSSADEQVQGAARQKLFQGVVDLVGQTQTDPRYQKSRGAYDQAVHNFEAGNNSVVVAAGNEGQVASTWEQIAFGRKLSVPSDFVHNDLANADTTTVGATRDWKGTPYPAEYSNGFQGVNLYASGYAHDSTPKAEEGSSFAAPRGAAALAGVHGKFPGISSSKAENLLRQQLTSNLPDYYGSPQAPALQEQQTLDFLRNQKF